jgi:hypothetical protein
MLIFGHLWVIILLSWIAWLILAEAVYLVLEFLEKKRKSVSLEQATKAEEPIPITIKELYHGFKDQDDRHAHEQCIGCGRTRYPRETDYLWSTRPYICDECVETYKNAVNLIENKHHLRGHQTPAFYITFGEKGQDSYYEEYQWWVDGVYATNKQEAAKMLKCPLEEVIKIGTSSVVRICERGCYKLCH